MSVCYPFNSLVETQFQMEHDNMHTIVVVIPGELLLSVREQILCMSVGFLRTDQA